MFEYPKKTKLTQAAIDGFPLSTNGKQITIYDTTLQGFALRIGATCKTFIVYKRVAYGAPKRVSLGKYGQITLTQARTWAQQRLADLSSGIDPIGVKKAKKAETIRTSEHTTQTVRWLLEEYRDKQLIEFKHGKPSSLDGLKKCFDYFGEKQLILLAKDGDEWKQDRPAQLSSWLDRPFREITRDEILERFGMFDIAKPARVQQKTGLQPITRTHQLCFKNLSAAYNFIIPFLELDIKENFRNPVDVLTTHKKWKKTNKRTNMLEFRKEEFSLWWNAAINYRQRNAVASDYIIFSLIQTGRSIDIAPLKWENVDLELEEIHYVRTKNDLEYKFPVTRLGMEILRRRKEFAINEYVFGYADSKTRHIPQDGKFHFKNIAETSGKLISHHDLRRTWGTAADFLQINDRIINFLLKHKMHDVNEHYLMKNYDSIKSALQSIEDFFLEQVKNTARQL